MNTRKKWAALFVVAGVIVLFLPSLLERARYRLRCNLMAEAELLPAVGAVFKDCSDCPEMVVIPPGSFRMGDLSGEGSNEEKPVHAVKIGYQFAVGKFEVTQAEWQTLMGSNPSEFKGNRRSVERVSWQDAKDFVWKLEVKTCKQYRLLSEAEWEYVARAGTTTKYHWGDTASHEHANYGGHQCCDGAAVGRDQWLKTSPVGSFPANSYGVHDMLGNVWEFTEDCWNWSYDGAPTDGSAWNTGECVKRVQRSGAWAHAPYSVRAAMRGRYYYMWEAGGFRVARSLP